MSLEKSPDLNDFDFAPQPSEEQAAPNTHKKTFRYLIFGLAALVLLLAMGNFWQGNLNNPLQGSGTVRGIVLDEKGKPIQNGYVKLPGTDISATIAGDGSFELKKVPAGTRNLVVLDRYTGQEIPFVLASGEVLNLGTIQFKTTTEPEF